MYFNKSIIFKNPKSQAIATIRHLQKIDLFAKTRAECQRYDFFRYPYFFLCGLRHVIFHAIVIGAVCVGKYCSSLLTNTSFFCENLTHTKAIWKAGGFQDCGKMEENRGEMGRKQAIIGLKYNPQS